MNKPPDRFDDEEPEEEPAPRRSGWTYANTPDDDLVRVEWVTDDRAEPLDNGEHGLRLTGLREVSGTFSGSLDYASSVLADMYGTSDGPVTLYMYGPDPNTPWWRHWFYRIREAVRGTPYPTIVLASGPVKMKLEKEEEDGDDVVISGTFTKAGAWEFHDKEVNQQ